MAYKIIEYPEFEELKRLFEENWRRNVIIMFTFCSIDYYGRAASKADYADRLVITKPDGTVIIHEREKREPLNWQPPKTIISVTYDDIEFQLKAVRVRPKEILVVKTPLVYYVSILEVGKGEFRLWGSEDDMVKTVIERPNLIEKGFKPIGREYKTPYGTVDLIGKDSRGRIMVLEFKRGVAQLSAVSQLMRYIEFFKEHHGEEIRGGIVAPGITASALELLRKHNLEYYKLPAKLIER